MTTSGIREMQLNMRSYQPYHKWSAFGLEDVKEIQNVIDFARGLVIKDERMAIEYETPTSLSQSDKFIRSNEDTLGNEISSFERDQYRKDYIETNKYYLSLVQMFNVDLYEARKAKDFQIIKVLNNTLSEKEKKVFFKAYYDSVRYYENVTSTHAFDNQQYNREFFQEYVIYMTVQRYFSYSMEGYFDVDTYNKKMLKNAFISYGLDYFDSFTVEYQRRTIKVINDLIRNKGTNQAFDIIKDIFSFNELLITRLSLAKTSRDKKSDELSFFKTDINSTIDVNLDQELPYDDVVKRDPYWRADKYDILKKSFNISNTKYLNVDILMDVLTNSTQMSYFYTLLSRVNDFNNIDLKEYAQSHNISYQEAKDISKRLGGISREEVEFNFVDRDISDAPINVFDAVVALIVLVYNREKMNKKIVHPTNNTNKRVFGFNYDNNVNDVLDKTRQYADWFRTHAPEFENSTQYQELRDIIDRFYLEDFNKDNSPLEFENIVLRYNSNSMYSIELRGIGQTIAQRNGSTKLYDLALRGEIYEAYDYLTKELLDNSRKLVPSDFISYTSTIDIWRTFVAYQVARGKMEVDFPLKRIVNGEEETVLQELRKFTEYISDPVLSRKLENYEKDPTLYNIKTTFSEISSAISRAINKGKISGISSNILMSYPDLYMYSSVFVNYDTYDKDTFSMQDIASIYQYNMGIRDDLIKISLETNNPHVHRAVEELLEKKFVTNLNNEVFMGYSSFEDYLRDKDPNLYYYTQIDTQDVKKRYDLIRDRVFQLATTIEGSIGLKSYDFFTQNNFVGIQEYIKRYIYILIQVFKAYSADTIFTDSVFKFGKGTQGKYDNSVRVLDEVIVGRTKLGLRDDIQFTDTMDWKSILKLDRDKISTNDKINIKIITE